MAAEITEGPPPVHAIEQIEAASLVWKDQTSSNSANMVQRTLSAIFELAQRSALKGKPNNAAWRIGSSSVMKRHKMEMMK